MTDISNVIIVIVGSPAEQHLIIVPIITHSVHKGTITSRTVPRKTAEVVEWNACL